MKLLLDWVYQGGFLMDGLGVVGLGLLGMAAARLAQRDKSWGGSLMAVGAVLLLIGRLWILLAAAFLTPAVSHGMSPMLLSALGALPKVLLTTGFGGVIWGLWGYEKLQRERATKVA